MRYEHIELDISTATCDALQKAVEGTMRLEMTDEVLMELRTFANELRARLQRTDVDPHCPKNVTTEDWLDT